eukprot:scaffold3072_cov116-Isochrysis_galbana.AAC.11
MAGKPSPSGIWPCPLPPQVNNSPRSERAALCHAPAARWCTRTPFKPAINRGTHCSSQSPWPRQTTAGPQLYTRPSSVTAMLQNSLAATPRTETCCIDSSGVGTASSSTSSPVCPCPSKPGQGSSSPGSDSSSSKPHASSLPDASTNRLCVVAAASGAWPAAVSHSRRRRYGTQPSTFWGSTRGTRRPHSDTRSRSASSTGEARHR